MSNLLAIVAIAIGVGGSIAMGVFQVKNGLDTLMNVEVFVFVGVLIWLYFKPVNDKSDPGD